MSSQKNWYLQYAFKNSAWLQEEDEEQFYHGWALWYKRTYRPSGCTAEGMAGGRIPHLFSSRSKARDAAKKRRQCNAKWRVTCTPIYVAISIAPMGPKEWMTEEEYRKRTNG